MFKKILNTKEIFYVFYLFKFILGITMNFDILVRLTSQKSTIIYYDMKDIIKKKKKIYKTPLGQTHDNKR